MKSIRSEFEQFSRLKRMRQRQRERGANGSNEGISAAILEDEEQERKSQDEEEESSSDLEEMSHASDADVDDGDDEPVLQLAPAAGALPRTASVSRIDSSLTDDQINEHFSRVLSQPVSARAGDASSSLHLSSSQPALDGYDAFASWR